MPVGPRDGADRIGTVADEFVCVLDAPGFHDAREFYADFGPVSDDAVRELLARRPGERPQPAD